MDGEFHLSLALFVLVALYGSSNVYIIAYLRRCGAYEIDGLEFLSLYLGNIRNYKRLNELFRDAYRREGGHAVLNGSVSVAHIAAPLLIPVAILVFVVFG